jgi:hypothetical protein
MKELTVHPLAARFPEMPDKDFQALKEGSMDFSSQ